MDLIQEQPVRVVLLLWLTSSSIASLVVTPLSDSAQWQSLFGLPYRLFYYIIVKKIQRQHPPHHLTASGSILKMIALEHCKIC